MAYEDAYAHVLEVSNVLYKCSHGADQDLWRLQVNFFDMDLKFTLETSIG